MLSPISAIAVFAAPYFISGKCFDAIFAHMAQSEALRKASQAYLDA